MKGKSDNWSFRRLDYILVILIFAGASTSLGIMSSYVNEAGVTSQQVAQGCQLLMGLDSFLAAGSIIGFFQFYGGFLQTFRTMTRSMARFRWRLNDREATQAAKEMNKEMTGTLVDIVGWETLTVFGFVASGIMAVLGIFFPYPFFVVLGLELTVSAILSMFLLWRLLAVSNARLQIMAFDTVEMVSVGTKPKPEIRIGSARVEHRDAGDLFYFDVVNEGRAPALGFLIRGRVVGEWDDFRAIGLSMQPHSLLQHAPESVYLGAIEKARDRMTVFTGKDSVSLGLNRRYEIEIQHVFQGVEPQLSKDVLIVDAQESHPKFSIESIAESRPK